MILEPARRASLLGTLEPIEENFPAIDDPDPVTVTLACLLDTNILSELVRRPQAFRDWDAVRWRS